MRRQRSHPGEGGNQRQLLRLNGSSEQTISAGQRACPLGGGATGQNRASVAEERTSAAGMTLIEIVIALLLFTIGFLAVAAMQVIGMQASMQAGLRAVDGNVAASTIEDILSWPYDDPRLTDRDGGFNPSHPDYGPFTVLPGGTAVEWEVEALGEDVAAKKICVTVRRKSRNGRPLSQSYHFLKPACSLMHVKGGTIHAP